MQYFMERLVNRAIQNSQSERISKFKVKSWTPDITIARDPGSGGQIVAQKIAKKLGWKLFDKSLMLKLSEELDIPPDEVANVDEHGRSWFSDVFHALVNPDYVSDVRYITQLKKLLTRASKHGDLVIMGHGANLILPPEKCLRVRITASFKKRVDNTYTFENKKTRQEAKEWVKNVEHKYNQFIRQYFGVNPHNPWNYDLVISTDEFSLGEVADLIIQAYLTKFPEQKKRLKTQSA
jgi:cytidylate kinase